MRFLCLVSDNLGHLDFGGGGFISLATGLQRLGHRVMWISKGGVAAKLESMGHEVLSFDGLKPIILLHSNSIERFDFDALAVESRHLKSMVASARPDVCLVDRNLTVAANLIDSLMIPRVAVGTPGGYWGRDDNGVVSLANPNRHYVDFAERLAQFVPGLNPGMDSFWQSSSTLNVVFVGKSFYPMVADTEATSFVNVFSQSESRSQLERERIGIAFGNTGNAESLAPLVDVIAASNCLPSSNVDLLVGNRDEKRWFYASGDCIVYNWVNYNEMLPRYRAIGFFGGIGTIWHAIDKQVPMLIVPGGAGDQQLNADRVEALQLGGQWSSDSSDLHSLHSVLSHVLNTDFSASFRRFKCDSNYTDTIESVLAKITILGK